MNNRFKEIYLKAENGMTFEVTEQGDSLLIRVLPQSTIGKYNSNYAINPVLPEGYSYVCGEVNTGFVIQDERSNQFVWVPVGVLPSNGTLDGENFFEKLGRRNYRDDKFSTDEFYEDMDDDLRRQFESVQKYGGYYISRYVVSKGDDGLFYTIKGAMPLVNIKFDTALEIAKKLGQGYVTSHMVYGAEWDSMLEWFQQTGKTLNDITNDSTSFGNYCDCKDSPQKMVETGSCDEWYVNNIADTAGNVWEWTQEANHGWAHVLRGGSYISSGYRCPVAYRSYSSTDNYNHFIGFRVALYIM